MAFKFHTDIKAKPISYNPSPRSLKNIKYIVIHATGDNETHDKTDTAKGNANYFAKWNTREAGAHFFVDDKDVYQSIAPSKIAKAVGGNKWDDCNKTGGGKCYRQCTNANSVSIELCSTKGKVTEKTLENAVLLTLDLMKKYHIESNKVIMHFDVNGKHCPYWNGWWNDGHKEWYKFKKRILDNGKV